MTFDPQDSKWTAYVLGELNEKERFAVEKELRRSAEARRLVADLRQTIALLSAELQTESQPMLLPAQRAAIDHGALSARRLFSREPAGLLSPAHAAPPARNTTVGFPSWGRWLAVAASLAVLVYVLIPPINSAREATRRVSSSYTGGDAVDSKLSPHYIDSAVNDPNEPSLKSDNRFITGNLPSGPADSSVNISKPTNGTPTVTAGTVGGGTTLYSGTTAINSNAGSGGTNLTVNANGGTTTFGATQHLKSLTVGRAGTTDVSGSAAISAPDNRYAGQTVSDAGTLTKSGTGTLTSDMPVGIDRRANTYTGTTTINGGTLGAGRGDSHKDNLPGDYSARAGSDLRWNHYKEADNRRNDSEADDAKFLADIDRQGVPSDRAAPYPGTEAYQSLPINPFMPAADEPLSTFAIDVDTGSYTNVRRHLMQRNQLPPPDAVRIEELVNYFRYDYPQPEAGAAFAVQCEVAQCPWNRQHRLARVGIKGREVANNQRPPSNLVFLIDVSGSMMPQDRLPLVKRGLAMMVDQLNENDHVAIVYYADGTGLALPSTSGDKKDKIKTVIERLAAGGSTNGAGGIELAYKVAVESFIKGGVNRVILATDGDFNVGVTDRTELINMIQQKAKSGVSLTTLGVGYGNLKDATLEQLADKGHGNYAYLDNLAEARRVLVEQMSGTLVTIAKDVKIQMEFNPGQVQSYRLLGYENRLMPHADFNNDAKAGGDIGAGHTVTALYEIVLVQKSENSRPEVDPLKYQQKVSLTKAAESGELFTLKLRYKQPDGDKSSLQEFPVKDSGKNYREASQDFKFASSVAAFGMILRHSPHKGDITLDAVAELAHDGFGSDDGGPRAEFVELVKRAKALGEK